MNIKLFFIGLGFLLVAYLFYLWIKNDKISTEDINGDGLSPSNFVGLWGSIIMFIILGLALIIKSIPF